MEKMACVVGVDWSDTKHAYAVRDSDQREYNGKFESRPEEVHEWVGELRRQHPAGMIVIGLEQSRGPLIYALSGYDFLELVPINPLAAKAYRDSLHLSGAKDDPVDAALIRDFVSTHRAVLRVWRPDQATTRKLRLLVEGRRTLVDQRTSFTQALTAALKHYFPQVLSWFSDVNGGLARAFLQRWPTLEQAATARPDAIRTLVAKHSRKAPEAVEALIASIRSAVPLTVDVAVIEGMSILATSYVTMLDAIQAPIDRYDEQIAELWNEHPDQEVFDSFPGAGAVLAPRLAAAFGMDRTRYEDASEIQKYSGIAPVVERSGKKAWVHSRWRCPKFLRQTFHEFAAASLPFSPWALAFYRLQRERGAGHHAAIRSLAFRWIRVLFQCWLTRCPYDEDTYVQGLKRRNSPLVRRLAA